MVVIVTVAGFTVLCTHLFVSNDSRNLQFLNFILRFMNIYMYNRFVRIRVRLHDTAKVSCTRTLNVAYNG